MTFRPYVIRSYNPYITCDVFTSLTSQTVLIMLILHCLPWQAAKKVGRRLLWAPGEVGQRKSSINHSWVALLSASHTTVVPSRLQIGSAGSDLTVVI